MVFKPKFIIIPVLLIMGIVLSYKAYSLFYRPPVHRFNADLQWLGVIDLNNAHDVSLHAIMNGEDAVLIIDHSALLYQEMKQKIPQASYLTPEELLNMANFHLFDTKSLGILTSKDPIFQHLFIIKFYNNGEQYDIKNLAAAGIVGIYLKNMPTGDHQVLMADGSQQTLVSANKFEKNE
jgi:hypothetical protein